jgi:hypothetical protein
MAAPEVKEQLRRGAAAEIPAALKSLATLLQGDDVQRQHDADRLMQIVLHEFVRAHDPTAAAALSGDWVAEAIRAENRITTESILERLSEHQVFDEQVRSLHPWRRDEAIEIRPSWPMIERLVQSLTAATSRTGLIRQWAERPPDWLDDAPVEVVSWLAQLAEDHGLPTSADGLFAAAIRRGAYPAVYWTARRAGCAYGSDPARAETLLESAAAQHPLARGLLAIHRESWGEAEEAFSGWETGSTQDTTMRLSWLARLHARAGHFNAAVAVAVEAAEMEGASGAALVAAEILLSKARYGVTVNRLADAEQAAALAIKARNARRAWQGDSAAAVVVAAKAFALADNWLRALAIVSPQPQGEATPEESADPRLKREAAELNAATGQYDRAQLLAVELGDPFVTAEVEALRSTGSGDEAAAIESWQLAYGAAKKETDRLVAVRGLAELGAELPDLAELESSNPELVGEIRLIREAMASGDKRLQALRNGAHQSLSLTVKLAEHYRADAEHRMAADVLKAGAERWNHPQLMLMAARDLWVAADPGGAQGAAQAALALGGPTWSGQFEARVLLFQVHSDAGALDEAIQQGRALVALDPHADQARWALVHALIGRGDTDAAWSALTPDGEPIPPRSRHDAMNWIALCARYDNSAQFVPRALSTMQRWPDDEQLLGRFIAQIYFGLRRQEITPSGDDIAALHAATNDYTDRFPDSAVFRKVSMSPDDPLQAFTEDLRDRYEALRDVLKSVQDEKAPLGLLASATGISYAEVSIRGGPGSTKAHRPAQEDQGRVAASSALDPMPCRTA